MCLEPIVTSAIIGFFGIVVGIGGYALQNWWIRNREREKREYVIKRRHYAQLVKTITWGIHIVQTKGEKTTPDFKKQLDEIVNVLWLYASDDVLKALNAYLTSGENKEFQNLILAMRKDLKISTGLRATEIQWFRAA